MAFGTIEVAAQLTNKMGVHAGCQSMPASSPPTGAAVCSAVRMYARIEGRSAASMTSKRRRSTQVAVAAPTAAVMNLAAKLHAGVVSPGKYSNIRAPAASSSASTLRTSDPRPFQPARVILPSRDPTDPTVSRAPYNAADPCQNT